MSKSINLLLVADYLIVKLQACFFWPKMNFNEKDHVSCMIEGKKEQRTEDQNF